MIAVILLVVNLYTYVTTGYSDKQMTWAFFLVFFLSLGIRFVSERYDRC